MRLSKTSCEMLLKLVSVGNSVRVIALIECSLESQEIIRLQQFNKIQLILFVKALYLLAFNKLP